jgi:hypothetical protein
MVKLGDLVVLDACVLYQAPLRDVLLSLAAEGLYQARWTQMIQNEWISNLLINRPDLQPAALTRTAELMNQAIPDSLVTNFEHLIDSIALPDPGDRHVLAAARTCGAQAIVTFNTKDFGTPPDVEILHPDDFCCQLYAADAITATHAFHTLRQRLRHRSKTAQQLVDIYQLQGLTNLSLVLRGIMDLL